MHIYIVACVLVYIHMLAYKSCVILADSKHNTTVPSCGDMELDSHVLSLCLNFILMKNLLDTHTHKINQTNQFQTHK